MYETPTHVLVPVTIPPDSADLICYGVRDIISVLARHPEASIERRRRLTMAALAAASVGTDRERRHYLELAILAERLVLGDAAATAAAVKWSTEHSPRIQAEPPARARQLATAHTCEDLLDILEQDGLDTDHRIALVQAITLRSGDDRKGPLEQSELEDLMRLIEPLVAGDPAALAAAREWVAKHVKSSAPWESSR